MFRALTILVIRPSPWGLSLQISHHWFFYFVIVTLCLQVCTHTVSLKLGRESQTVSTTSVDLYQITTRVYLAEPWIKLVSADYYVETKGHLQTIFDTKHLRQFHSFFVIEVSTYKERIVLSQRKYVTDLLDEMGMFGTKPTKILVNHRVHMYDDWWIISRSW